MRNQQPLSRIAVPKPWREIVGSLAYAAFILFFVAVAFFNLLHGVAWIVSVLWLLIVVLAVGLSCWSEGLRAYLVNLAGEFSLSHFAEVVPGEDGANQVRFGFYFLWWSFFYKTIPVSKIESVEWHTGQSSDFARRDMGDWRVALWFDHNDPMKSARHSHLKKPEQDVYLVGPSGPKVITSEFGRDLLVFLQQAGVVLGQEKDECTFVRPSENRGVKFP